MRRLLLSIVVCFIMGFLPLYAQSGTNGLNYQAVVRDASGKVFPNEPVRIKIALVSENQNQEAYYTEVHQVTTDFLGQVSLVIGKGQDPQGVFSKIPWSEEQIWLDLELLGTKDNFKINSRTQLLSVPYALHAATTSKLSEEQAIEKDGGQSIFWLTSGNSNTRDTVHFVGTIDNKPYAIRTNNQPLVTFKDGQVVVTGRVSGDASDMANYPLTIEGSKQGINIKVNGSRGNDNNFVTFADDNGVMGRIEGERFSEKVNQWDYNLQVSVFTIEGVSLAIQIIGQIIEGIGEGFSIFGAGAVPGAVANAVALGIEAASFLAESITWGQKQSEEIGVTFQSGNGDYAEWLKRAPGEQDLNYGEIVGVKGGLISLNTTKADKILVISKNPAVIGNAPQENQKANYEKVAFMGQVPVKVAGPVAIGDFIVASGNNDGCGVAIHPQDMKTGDFAHVLGVAWEATADHPINLVKVAIGINTNDLSAKLDALNNSIDNIMAYLEGKAPLLEDDQIPSASLRGDKPSTQFQKQFSDEEFDRLLDQNAELFNTMYAETKVQLQKKGYDFAAFPQVAEFLDNPLPAIKAMRRNPMYLTQWALSDANYKKIQKTK
jgi:hypothetical protein